MIKREEIIGDCRLLLGDCAEVMPLLGPLSIDMAVCDPPYVMTKNGKSCRPNYMPPVSSGNLFNGTLPDTDNWMKNLFDVMSEESHFYTFSNVNSLGEYLHSAGMSGFKLHNIISMIKDTKMPNRWYLKYTELVLFFRKGKAKRINDATSRDYVHVVMPKRSTGKTHITEKPLSFIETLIRNSSRTGDTILDCFMGSGTTGVACLKMGRKFIGIEIDEGYFDIACRRIREAYKHDDNLVETAKPHSPKQESLFGEA